MDNFPIKIELAHPIEVGDERIACLEIKRRPRAKDLRAMDKETGDIAKSAALLAALTDTLPSYIDMMDGADFIKATEIVGRFLS